jgi:hypothetical protein
MNTAHATWNIAKTKKLVQAKFGRDYLEVVAPSLNSMSERLSFARYHHSEIQRLLSHFSKSHLQDSSLIIVTHGSNAELRAEFEDLMIAIGAHCVACTLSIHALADIASFALYQSLGYARSPNAIPERRISLSTVIRAFNGNPKHTQLSALLKELESNSAFKHVAALANRSKHQSVVKPMLNEDWTGEREERHQIRFPAFKLGKITYPEAELKSLLEPAYAITSVTIVEAGIELHRQLSENAA